MQGLKAAANSCKITKTRKVSVEVGLDELAIAFRAFLMVEMDTSQELAQKAWELFWPYVKRSPGYTVRVNGRVVVKRQRVLNKATRAKIAALKKKQQA